MNVPSVKRSIARGRLDGLIRDAVRRFQRLTGLTAVTTFGSVSGDPAIRSLPSPPVHPVCVKFLREAPDRADCDREWQSHLRLAERTHGPWMHTCPIGLRCAGVPIVLGEELLGLAKVVSGPEVSMERFRAHVDLLEALIARPCQELYVFVLLGEIQTLQTLVERRRPVNVTEWPQSRADALVARSQTDAAATHHAQTLISQVLDYLNAHYADSDLSLTQVADAVGKNEKYLAHLFVQQIGERMRAYITTLRVRRACELLLQTDWTIERIAQDSGFAHAVQLRQSFRRAIGVTATEYRQMFSAGA